MNVFVLCTGRSGSTTFHRACQHITNYTCSHELNTSEVGGARFAYPEDHIEIDNHLSWLLGRLDEAFGNRAFYVHLMRDEEMTAKSFDKRWAGRYSIIRAYSEGVLGPRGPDGGALPGLLPNRERQHIPFPQGQDADHDLSRGEGP